MASQRAGAVAVAGIATKTIGAMQGEGGVTVPSKSASPAAVAGVVPATRFTTVGAPAASLLWQLRITAKFAIGFVPLATSTRPRTLTSILPVVFISASPEAIFHGAPAPPMPRIGLAAPVNGGTTAVSRLNSKRLRASSAPFLAEATLPARSKHASRTESLFIGRLHFFFSNVVRAHKTIHSGELDRQRSSYFAHAQKHARKGGIIIREAPAARR